MQLKAKLILAGCLLAALVAVYGYSAARPSNMSEAVDGDALQRRLQGTWESLGSKPDTEQINLITRNHFSWVFYNRITKQPVMMAGGRCSFSGDTYTEHVEYGSVGAQHDLAGHDQTFKIRFDKDRIIKTGTLSNGMKINEIWRRVE